MTVSTRLKLISWNVWGLGKKLKDSEFVDILTQNDIVCLPETWTSVQSNVKIRQYENIHRYRLKRRRKGGILVYYKKSLKAGILEGFNLV